MRLNDITVPYISKQGGELVENSSDKLNISNFFRRKTRLIKMLLKMGMRMMLLIKTLEFP
jgi:hypothetical protein